MITVPGWTIYATGGMSYGDTPTDLLDDFRDLDETRLSKAAGFFYPDPAFNTVPS